MINKTISSQETVYSGRLIAVVQQTVEWDNGVERGTTVHELVRRPPGIRAILIDEQHRMLLIREFRTEHDGWDMRLPGGKVFDTFSQYDEACNADTLSIAIEDAVRREVREEVGAIVKSCHLLECSRCGATIEWDLYYFHISEFDSPPANHRVEGDEIITSEWKTLEEVRKLCLDGEIKEDRSVAVLLRFLETHG